MLLRKVLPLLSLLFCLSLVFTSCGDEDPCDGVTCATGFVCEDGDCVASDPCAGITCPAGQICVNGSCEDDTNINTTETVSGTIATNTTWTANTIYKLNGRVIVPDGVSLTIMPGTIIKGLPGADESASTLIISRGGQLRAEGTATSPIIFTADDDNIEIGQMAGTNLTKLNNELWGGIMILGRAPVSVGDGDTEGQIEGIPANEEAGKYGGNDPDDSSGILTYVSIRHGGISIGDGNEINGITLGGVGAGTVMNHIEVAATLDDGIEFFGGTVSVDNIVIGYQGDDGVDVDQNWSGTVDNFLVIHGGADTDEALEIDGPENDTYKDGKFSLINGTCIAVDTEKTSGGDFKSKAQGTVSGVSWRGYDTFVKVRASFDPDNACASKSDSYTNMTSDCLVFTNNEVVSSTAAAADVATVYSDDDPGEEDCFNAVADTYQDAADTAIVAGGNAVNASATLGADMSEFDGWTLASINNWY